MLLVSMVVRCRICSAVSPATSAGSAASASLQMPAASSEPAGAAAAADDAAAAGAPAPSPLDIERAGGVSARELLELGEGPHKK